MIKLFSNPNSNKYNGRMFPFHNIFSDDFNKKHKEIINIGISSVHDDFIIKKIIYNSSNSSNIYFKPWNLIENIRTVDIIIIPEVVYNNSDNNSNINFSDFSNFSPVANLYESHFIFLCANTLSFRNISDLKNVKINVFRRGSYEEVLMLKIIKEIGLLGIELTYYSDEQLMNFYGTKKCYIVLILSAHKNSFINKLSKKVLSHFLNNNTGLKLDNGYNNSVINRNSLVPRLYSYITTIDKNSDLYLKSISVRMILIARNSVSALEISNMIARLIQLISDRKLRENPNFIFLKDIQINLLNNIRSKVEFHKGAYETYKQMNLIRDFPVLFFS